MSEYRGHVDSGRYSEGIERVLGEMRSTCHGGCQATVRPEEGGQVDKVGADGWN